MQTYQVDHDALVWCNACTLVICTNRGYLCRDCLKKRGLEEAVCADGVSDLGVYQNCCVGCGNIRLFYCSPLRCATCQSQKRVAEPYLALEEIIGLAGVVVHTDCLPAHAVLPHFEFVPTAPLAELSTEPGILAGTSDCYPRTPDFQGLCTPSFLPMEPFSLSRSNSPSPFTL